MLVPMRFALLMQFEGRVLRFSITFSLIHRPSNLIPFMDTLDVIEERLHLLQCFSRLGAGGDGVPEMRIYVLYPRAQRTAPNELSFLYRLIG